MSDPTLKPPVGAPRPVGDPATDLLAQLIAELVSIVLARLMERLRGRLARRDRAESPAKVEARYVRAARIMQDMGIGGGGPGAVSAAVRAAEGAYWGGAE